MMRLRTSVWTLFAVTTLVAAGCISSPGYNLPPAPRLAAPGPGVTGPGPGVLAPMPGMGSACEGQMMPSMQAVQVLFAKPEGMQVQWDVGGVGQFDSLPLVVPGRYNFQTASIYRLKLTNIPGQEGVELYPTLELGPPTPRTQAFLAHNAIPAQLTVDDFNQVVSGNYVTKVIYLPDPEFQQPAVAGVDTLVSTRLEPGVDPIVEADRRGAILAVVRVGNKDMEMPGANIEESFMMPGQMTQGPAAMAGYGGSLGPSPGHVAGVNTLPYGMPITGTPIGLPGPPHIPLGIPAGLQKHVMKNHTRQNLPDPTEKIKIHVKQHPKVSYPTPPSKAWIHQYNHPSCAHCLPGQPCGQCGMGQACGQCPPGQPCAHVGMGQAGAY